MGMRSKIRRLFRPQTRLEVFFLIYAIALGAMERAKHYLEAFPGANGVILAIACTAVVFVAGGMLLDGLQRPEAPATARPAVTAPRRKRSRAFTRSRRMPSRTAHGEASRG